MKLKSWFFFSRHLSVLWASFSNHKLITKKCGVGFFFLLIWIQNITALKINFIQSSLIFIKKCLNFFLSQLICNLIKKMFFFLNNALIMNSMYRFNRNTLNDYYLEAPDNIMFRLFFCFLCISVVGLLMKKTRKWFCFRKYFHAWMKSAGEKTMITFFFSVVYCHCLLLLLVQRGKAIIYRPTSRTSDGDGGKK